MSLVIMRSISGSGKTSIANTLFAPHQILSSDNMRMEMYGTMDMPPHACGLMWVEFYRRLHYACQFHLPTCVDATHLTSKSINKVTKIANMFNTKYMIASILPDINKSRDTILDRQRGYQVGAKMPLGVLDDQLVRYNDHTNNIRINNMIEFVEGTYQYCCERIDKFIQTRNTFTVGDNTFIIGDIHGKIGELRLLLKEIPHNAAIFSAGDLIDRGEDSVESVNVLLHDDRFQGYSYGNHDINFIHEYMGLMECRSKERRATHDIVSQLSERRQKEFISQLLQGSPYIELVCDGYDPVLITHTGLEKFDPWVTNIHDTVSDRINNVDLIDDDMKHLQVHGHRSWEYSGDFEGNVVNVDSGCYDTGVLTAFNPFTREVIHVKSKNI